MPSPQPSPSVSALARPRLLLLDCLRLAAALGVVAYHYTAVFGQLFWGAPSHEIFPRLSGITAYGALGVQLFFIISGFVILMSAYGRSVGQFTASRLSRLFPAYWTAVVLAALLLLVISPSEMNMVTWTDALVNLTMLQQSIGVSSLDGVFWTLWIELLFYVTIALFLWRGMTQWRLLAFIFLWPFLGMLSIQSGAGILKTLLIPEYSPLFAVGMGLYLIHAHGHDIVRWLAVAVNVVLGCHQTAATFLPAMSQSTGQELSPGVGWLVILSFVAVVSLITTTSLRYSGWRWMSIAGSLTYPLYLVHEMWGWWIIKSLHTTIGTWPSVTVATGTTILMAWLIHRLIERRFAKGLNKRLLRSLTSGSHPADRPDNRSDAAATVTVFR
ncbi:peptidoglycan/LPS O-acetylase OafA/YrhL [Pseudarthrobacter siccitolerans]|uniref:Peptidoglycan/LPS O-acetylase OafA/YrhL n=1 Tax=Pseudarthrobacter siccitolerans TaxID=861266 RepID=A0ABU0PHK7_9MICC|nr:acyltransferase [Pseudarthrobacter siccitolerans]MDQ0673445.1 peptidoglycan/LPS O-acetylase OafA/YrhL [Pseudarthrobacter siccitolerans]